MALGLAVVMNIGSYWFSDKIVLAMYRAQPVGPDHPLYQLTQRLAQRAGLPMPRVFIIPDASPNAFATGRNPEHAAVAATEGILQLLSEDELAGVIAHELAHVKHRDILISSVAATIATAIMFAAQMARFAAMFGGGRSSDDRDGGGTNPIALLALVILAPLAAMLIQTAISRSREFAADAGGARDRRQPARSGQRAAQAGDGVEAAAARCQPGDGPHVHHQAVHRRRPALALQHASAHRAADCRADGPMTGRRGAVCGKAPLP